MARRVPEKMCNAKVVKNSNYSPSSSCWCSDLWRMAYQPSLQVFPLEGHGKNSSATTRGYWLCIGSNLFLVSVAFCKTWRKQGNSADMPDWKYGLQCSNWCISQQSAGKECRLLLWNLFSQKRFCQVRREIAFKVSSWVLNEFIRSSGTLLPYFLLRDCKENHVTECHDAVCSKMNQQWMNLAWSF